MTDEELRQIVESNARAIQGNSEAIRANSEAIKANSEVIKTLGQKFDEALGRLAAKLDRLADISQGNYQRVVRAETGAVNNESAWLDAMTKIDRLEQRLAELEEGNK